MTRFPPRPRPAAADVAIRAAGPADLPACADVWQVSISDYLRRLNQPEVMTNLDSLVELLGHLRATDPETFLVAERLTSDSTGEAGRVVAFASATQREHVWFLALLFVEPAFQRRGIGSDLLTRVFPRAPAGGTMPPASRPGVMATCTDSIQPISNALYARYGIVPRMPVFNLVGRPRSEAEAFPGLPAGVAALPFSELSREAGLTEPSTPTELLLADTIESIDRSVLGYAHPADHRYLRRSGRAGFLYRGPDGEALGYGYASPVGRVGPVSVVDETLTAPVLGHLLTAVSPRGASSCWIPGANDRAIVALLRAGLRFEGFPCLLCETRPYADFSRYVPAALSIL